MAINRLAISNASANTDTVLYTAVRNCLTSVIATNKSSSQSLVRIWVVPSGQSGTPAKWAHIAYDSIVTGNNSLETFRFPLENGDLVYVRADSANISFSISGIYENSGAQKIFYDSTAPAAPAIGDIWVNSGASYSNTNTSAVIAYQAAEPTTKTPNLLWVDSSGNSTVYANQNAVTGDWSVTGQITSYSKSGMDPLNSAGSSSKAALITQGSYGGGITMIDGTGLWGIRVQEYGGTLRFGYGTTSSVITDNLVLTNTGRVGVGTTSPATKLQLNLTSGDGITFSDGTYTHLIDQRGNTLDIRSDQTGTNGDIRIFNNGANERLRLDSNGYFLVGYTASQGAYKLQVNSQIFATSSTIATSDGRYKENVESITGGLDLIDSLRPVSFDWKSHPIHNFPEGKTIGFIAQEVKESLADQNWIDNLVKLNVNEETGEEFYGIAEGNIIPLLVSAVKELRAEVKTLKEQLNG